VKIADRNKPKMKNDTNSRNSRFCSESIKFFILIIKYPSIQLPLMQSTQNFGELNGSSSEGLKYKVTAEAKTIIEVKDTLLVDFSVLTFFINVSYLMLRAQPRI
jgi:hypothetical protein